MDKPSARPQTREPSADLYRILAVVIVVVGHWLLAAVTYGDRRFGYDEVLVALPSTQWSTWFFQVVPVFFMVGGYANAASWTRRNRSASDAEWGPWLRHRVAGILGPVTAYVTFLLAAVAVSAIAGMNSHQLATITWLLSMHLWFLPVYLVVVSMTPFAVAAQRRWGLKATVTMALGVVAVDVITLAGHVPMLGWLNYALCWGAIYQAGIAWHSGALRGRRAALLAVCGAIVLATVIGLGLYPVSMIGVPGQAVQNTSPPSVALLALAAVQTGVLVAASPPVGSWLRRARWRHYIALANDNALALYLWHLFPVVVVALVAYPFGLLPQPELGSASWWWWRFAWVTALSTVTVVELALLWLGRSVFARPLPNLSVRLTIRLSQGVQVAGIAMAVCALWRFSADGFAPTGHFPVVNALMYAGGVALVCLGPTDAGPAGTGTLGPTVKQRDSGPSRQASTARQELEGQQHQ